MIGGFSSASLLLNRAVSEKAGGLTDDDDGTSGDEPGLGSQLFSCHLANLVRPEIDQFLGRFASLFRYSSIVLGMPLPDEIRGGEREEKADKLQKRFEDKFRPGRIQLHR